jgi:hypothetical protein
MRDGSLAALGWVMSKGMEDRELGLLLSSGSVLCLLGRDQLQVEQVKKKEKRINRSLIPWRNYFNRILTWR